MLFNIDPTFTCEANRIIMDRMNSAKKYTHGPIQRSLTALTAPRRLSIQSAHFTHPSAPVLFFAVSGEP